MLLISLMSSSSVSAEPVDESSSPPSTGRGEPAREEENIVMKANQLIRGRINWTKLEHRVVAMLVAQLKRDDDAFEMQRVHISDLMDMAQISSRDIYSRAEEVCRKLLNQKVHVRTRTEDGRRMYQGYNCLSTCRYVEGSGYIEAKFNDDMKPFLLQLKRQFTMYRLQNFMQLSSQHSMRMYELIKMQEGLRHLRLSVEELREVLCCKHTYDRFSDFRRYVLERARTEIEETCDTYYTYAVEREGRTPKWVRFLIHRCENDSPPALVSQDEKQSSSSRGAPVPGEPESDQAHSDTPAPASEHACSRTALQRAEDRYDLYVSVLARLEQETLDNVSQSSLRSALEQGRTAVRPVAPDVSSDAVADEVVRRTVTTVQA
jgi:plasmid replication initiation protein